LFDGRSPRDLVDGIYAAVRAYAGDARGDDVTLVAMCVREAR
jgi:serine phosphatase RsbU (regulator of sigma subunit)